MLAVPNLVPGSGFERFTVMEKSEEVTGGHVTSSYKETERIFWGILAQASQHEQEKYNQLGHPITHTIVQHGSINRANATDILRSNTGRTFYVEGVESPAAVFSTMIYQVKERFDLNGNNRKRS